MNCTPSAATHWLSFDPVEYAIRSAPPPLRSADCGKPPTQFFSINDGFRLMIRNGFDARMVCPNGVVNECWATASRYFYNGEIGDEEIDLQQAQILAVKVSGKLLTTLGVDIVVP